MLESAGQFVLLEHVQDSGRHWDLMFEGGLMLVTWQLMQNPIAGAGVTETGPVFARRLADHRRAYLDYQGEISGDRGSVTRLDQGRFFLIGKQPGRLILDMRGQHLAGKYELIKSTDKEHSRGSEIWQFACISS